MSIQVIKKGKKVMSYRIFGDTKFHTLQTLVKMMKKKRIPRVDVSDGTYIKLIRYNL